MKTPDAPMNLHERGKMRRKQRIVDAIVDIVDDEGMSALTIARVSERAEVSVKTIYNLVGSLDGILYEMSRTHFSSLASQLAVDDRAEDIRQLFDRMVDRGYDFLKSDKKRNRAALTAILHANIATRRSYRNTPPASDQFRYISKGIRLFATEGLIRPSVNVDLLAEQMLYADAMLLELWVAKRIDLERYALTYKYHIWTLLRAWAGSAFIEYSDARISDIQDELAALKSNLNTPLEQKTS